jgi:hypothetical protein
MTGIAKIRFCLAIVLLGLVPSVAAQGIPRKLWGKWVIHRDVPTSTISCWGDEQARVIIGTQIEYRSDLFRWKNIVAKHPSVKTVVISAQRFREENSGGGARGSQVSFSQLGIKAPEATQVTIEHAPADVTGGTTEIPGDRVFIKDENTIVFSVCNLYFEAKRVTSITPR